MLTLKQIVTQIRSEDWFVAIDLKDAYFHASILPQHRKFLRFSFGGKEYQYWVLPFGLALSPRTFTKSTSVHAHTSSPPRPERYGAGVAPDCTHFPLLLCSQELWRESVGME